MTTQADIAGNSNIANNDTPIIIAIILVLVIVVAVAMIARAVSEKKSKGTEYKYETEIPESRTERKTEPRAGMRTETGKEAKRKINPAPPVDKDCIKLYVYEDTFSGWRCSCCEGENELSRDICQVCGKKRKWR